jgi:carbamoylphosphate synthase large subunit
MAAKYQWKAIIVIGPGPRRAVGNEQYAHGVVRACTTLAAGGHRVILLDNAPYLALPDEQRGIQRRVEPLIPATLEGIAAEVDSPFIYPDAGGDGAQRLAQKVATWPSLGSGPLVTALALERGRLLRRCDEVGLPTLPHAFVDSVAAALEKAQEMGYPLHVNRTAGERRNPPQQDEVESETVVGLGDATSIQSLIYNQSDLETWAEQQLEIHPGATLLLEKAHLGWRRFEVVLLQDASGDLVIAGLQAYFEPTGVPVAASGWVQPTGELETALVEAITPRCTELLAGYDLKGLAALTVALDPSSQTPLILDLTLGNSPNIAFAATASGQPLYEMAAELALGASLSQVWPTTARELAPPGTTAVRLPVVLPHLTSASKADDEVAPPSVGDAMGIGVHLGEAFEKALAACGAAIEKSSHPTHRELGTVDPERYLRKAPRSNWIAQALQAWENDRSGTETSEYPFIQMPPATATGTTAYQWERLDSVASAMPTPAIGRILVIAGRPNTIGQSRELDLATAQAVAALKSAGRDALILCSDPLSCAMGPIDGARVLIGPADMTTIQAIHRSLPLDGVLLNSTPGLFLPLAAELKAAGIPVLGISSRALTLLNSPMALHERLTDLGIPHPRRRLAADAEAARDLADAMGYPLLLRPLPSAGGKLTTGSGEVTLIMNADMLSARIESAATDTGYLMEEFLEFAIELSADAICDGTDTCIPQVVEHIELAGIHPGDAAWVIPPYSTPLRHVDTICEYLQKIALEMGHKGFISGRFAFFNDTVYLLDVHLAFTRTGAFVSDTCQLPLFEAATRAMLGERLTKIQLPPGELKGFSVREAVFPVSAETKLASRLGPLMQSTGEVIGRADTFGMAYYKSQQAAGDRLPTAGSVLITVTGADKPSIIEPARLFREMGFRLMATRGTARFLEQNGILADTVRKLGMGRPDLVDAIKTHQVDLVINTPSGQQGQMDDGYIRKAAIQYNIPYISTPAGALAAAKGIAARRRQTGYNGTAPR